MPIEVNHAGSGVAAFLLSLTTLLVLEKNGTLAHHELAEVVDRALMQLETIDQEPSLQSQEAWRFARTLLEQARAPLSRSNSLAKTANARTQRKEQATSSCRKSIQERRHPSRQGG